jgi:hypothetical protein
MKGLCFKLSWRGTITYGAMPFGYCTLQRLSREGKTPERGEKTITPTTEAQRHRDFTEKTFKINALLCVASVSLCLCGGLLLFTAATRASPQLSPEINPVRKA